MNAPLSSTPPDALDLDARILAAEHAVLVRDQRVRRDAGAFAALLRVRTRNGARVAAVAAIAPFLAGWFMARGARRSRRDGEPRPPRLAEAHWAGLVPLLWPLLPRAMRSKVSPGVASFVTGLGLPLVAQGLAKRAERRRAAAADDGAR